jgi:hypothetical protein
MRSAYHPSLSAISGVHSVEKGPREVKRRPSVKALASSDRGEDKNIITPHAAAVATAMSGAPTERFARRSRAVRLNRGMASRVVHPPFEVVSKAASPRSWHSMALPVRVCCAQGHPKYGQIIFTHLPMRTRSLLLALFTEAI